MSSDIDSLIDSENWRAARRLLRAALRLDPVDHWLISRMALTYYEEFNYSRSLKCELQAYAIAPHCPLVLWGLAGSLYMLGRENEALALYRRIVRRGKQKLAYGECGEGMARARGMYADCMYRISRCYGATGNRRLAITYLKKHLAERGPGCQSIYSLDEIRREAEQLIESESSQEKQPADRKKGDLSN